MSRELLLVSVLLATYAAVSSMAGLVVALAWMRLHARGVALPARGWFWLRLLPALAGVGVSLGLVAPAFVLYEPVHDGEGVGPLLVALSASAIALMLPAVGTLGRAMRSGRAFERLHLDAAQVSRVAGASLPFHIVERAGLLVALVGVVRPRLVLSTEVRAACTEEELATIAAHEAAHLRARDNLKRLLLDTCPDVLRLTCTHRRLALAWSAAAEEEADTAATGADGRRGRVVLAALLVKLARLTAAPVSAPPLSSPLIEPDDLAFRVRRLLDGPVERRSAPAWRGLLLATAGAVLAALGWAWSAAGVLQGVHHASELLVRFGR